MANTPADRIALEHTGVWIKGVYYVQGKPLFIEDSEGVPVPIQDSSQCALAPTTNSLT